MPHLPSGRAAGGGNGAAEFIGGQSSKIAGRAKSLRLETGRFCRAEDAALAFRRTQPCRFGHRLRHVLLKRFGWGWYADPPPLRAAHYDLGWHFGDLKPIRWALAHTHPTFLELALTRNGPARVLRNVRAAVIGACQWSPNRLGRTRIDTAINRRSRSCGAPAPGVGVGGR